MEGGRPLVLQDIEADSSESVNVRVVDLGTEEDLGSNERILFRKEKLQGEKSTFIGRVSGASNLDEEMSGV